MTGKNISFFSSIIFSVNNFSEKKKRKKSQRLTSYLVEMFKGEHNLSDIDLHLVLCETLSLRKMSKKFSTIYII